MNISLLADYRSLSLYLVSRDDLELAMDALSDL